MYLSEDPQPASRMPLFINMILQTGDSNIREHCGIRKDLGRRWFAGYLSTASKTWFFPSHGDTCGEKLYTLTSEARVPGDLPDADDFQLQQIVNEAIDIVVSVQYKRCVPEDWN